MKIYDDLGIAVPEIYLPKAGTDLTKWAVVACDQFTSEPEYWHSVEQKVGAAPSTLNLIFPEIYLEAPGKEKRILDIHAAMGRYLDGGLLTPREGMLYVERHVDGKKRRGLMLCLDLERYDYSRASSSMIRATEGTIIERLPPRMSIREGAKLELPHILVLIDDREGTVIEPLEADSVGRRPLYDFDLMFDSGHLTGFGVGAAAQDKVVEALRQLADVATFQKKYGVGDDASVLLFAMGDGNHSLATAKAVWEKLKSKVRSDHPARYALVEIENVHDKGLEFEPIHRVLFGLKKDLLKDLQATFGGDLAYRSVSTAQEMISLVDSGAGPLQAIGLVRGDGPDTFGLLQIARPTSNLPVGTLQTFLDSFMQEAKAQKLDYVHGNEVVVKLGAKQGNAGFYLPRMSKSSLFKTVILDGMLPRKTFSMGEAREKRFYMEARRIA